MRKVHLLPLLVSLGLTLPCWGGELQGKILLKSDLAQRKIGKKRADAQPGPGYSQDVPRPSESELENVVIYLEGNNLPATPLKSRGPDNTLRQKNKEFLPHVLPVVKGSRVYFSNEDDFVHHIYSESEPGAFEISKHTKDNLKPQTFEESNVVETFCGIHTKMNCYILVLRNDCFSRVNSQGRYRIRSIPAGTYKLTAWHPQLAKPVVKTVVVPASGVLDETIEL